MKTKSRRTALNMRREDLSEYGLSLGIWECLTKDFGLPIDTHEVEIVISDVRRVV